MIKDCKIIKEIAKGGQKTVHLAQHPDFGLVVIKKGEIKSFTSLERIKREVVLLADLSSVYYPRQYHFNIDVKTMEFEIVEDYIEGEMLRNTMTRFKYPTDIFALLKSLIDGLSIIWDKNIVHRDLKPENIIIRPSGIPCILDLGIARFLDLESLTKTISPMGPCTPIYAAPEQLANNKNLIDPRTDFFCLGIIALELFLGSHPFDPVIVGNHFSIVENIMQNKFAIETDSVSRNEGMKEFAEKTLRSQPYQRFRTYELLNNFVTKQI